MDNIKEVANDYRSKNGDGTLTNKELLWFVIKKFDDLEIRVTRTESKQNMMLWFIPVAIAATGIIISLV